MKLSSTKRIESKALPGVAFVIRRISAQRRDEIDELTRPIAENMPDREEYADLSKERESGKLSDEKESRWLTLNIRAARIYVREVLPAVVRLCLVRIEGLDIEDENGQTQPATVDNLKACCEDADKLWDEIVDAVERERGLRPDEAKNSDSPSTLAAPEGGNPESAASAENAETITPSVA